MTTKKEKQTKIKPSKGQKKEKIDLNDPDKNALLKIENKANFEISTGNLLQNPSLLIYPNFEKIDITKEKDHFNTSKLKQSSQIIVVLRYFEYLCTAKFSFSYIIPILESNLSIKDVFEMIKHCLRNKLLLNAPSFDNIYDIDIAYDAYIKY